MYPKPQCQRMAKEMVLELEGGAECSSTILFPSSLCLSQPNTHWSLRYLCRNTESATGIGAIRAPCRSSAGLFWDLFLPWGTNTCEMQSQAALSVGLWFCSSNERQRGWWEKARSQGISLFSIFQCLRHVMQLLPRSLRSSYFFLSIYNLHSLVTVTPHTALPSSMWYLSSSLTYVTNYAP